MRLRAALLPLAALGLYTGCGYVGPIVPPSPLIPNTVVDLAVVERGEHLDVTFTPPSQTTDKFPITKFSSFELDINGKSYEVPVSEKPVDYKVPVADWVNQQVTVKVRTAVKEKKSYSGWSNAVALRVLPPLHAPKVTIAGTGEGYRLTWDGAGSGVKYEVLRKGPDDKSFVSVGTTDATRFVDSTAQWSTPYEYRLVAHEGSAESVPGEVAEVNLPDIYPPAVPADLTALATADQIELTWLRDKEADLKGYLIYRAAGDSRYERIGELTAVPNFSDIHVEHGKTYQYRVSAVDQAGNESARSEAVSVTFP